MSSKRLSVMALPELELTKHDTVALSQLRVDLEAEVFAQYEDFLWSRKRNVDVRKWKFLRTEDDLHAYVERTESSSLTLSAAAQLMANEPQAHMSVQLGRGRVMIVGTIPGTLDDIMYVQSYHDTASLRTKCAYQNDFVDEAAVLNCMEDATDEDPYRFTGISWFRRTFPLLVKDREALVFDDVRLAKLSNGERVGVNVSHSINHHDFPEIKELSTKRVNASIVAVFRQYDANNVDVFMLHVLDDKTIGPESMLLQQQAKSMMSVKTLSDAALTRKLYFLLRERTRRNRTRGRSGTLNTGLDENGEKRKRCEYCEKRLCSMANPSRQCQLCDHNICQKCVVTKDLIVDASPSETVVKPFGFCVACVLHTGTVRAFDVARKEARERAKAAANVMLREANLSASSDSTTSSGSSLSR